VKEEKYFLRPTLQFVLREKKEEARKKKETKCVTQTGELVRKKNGSLQPSKAELKKARKGNTTG